MRRGFVQTTSATNRRRKTKIAAPLYHYFPFNLFFLSCSILLHALEYSLCVKLVKILFLLDVFHLISRHLHGNVAFG